MNNFVCDFFSAHLSFRLQRFQQEKIEFRNEIFSFPEITRVMQTSYFRTIRRLQFTYMRCQWRWLAPTWNEPNPFYDGFLFPETYVQSFHTFCPIRQCLSDTIYGLSVFEKKLFYLHAWFNSTNLIPFSWMEKIVHFDKFSIYPELISSFLKGVPFWSWSSFPWKSPPVAVNCFPIRGSNTRNVNHEHFPWSTLLSGLYSLQSQTRLQKHLVFIVIFFQRHFLPNWPTGFLASAPKSMKFKILKVFGYENTSV